VKFTINKAALTKMLRALTRDSGKKKSERDPHLRVAAHNDIVTMSANDVEAGCAAEVTEEGVCFFQYEQFLPLVRTYANATDLTIEVTRDGIQIGNTKISRGFWEVSLFDNPDSAPETLPKPPTKESQRDRGQQEFGLNP
jgi:hypothetical protein